MVPYFWIRDINPLTHMRLLRLARRRRQSIYDVARELLFEHAGREQIFDFRERTALAAARKAKVKVRRI